jgi:serine/threonine-protein kinase
VTLDDPPATVSGMARVVLSAQGRLTGFLAVPPQVEASDGEWPEPDWSPLFAEAGLERGTFQAVRPQWAAPVDSDRKAAWTMPMDGRGSGELRVEAAAYHGRPVWFAVLPPWSQPSHDHASLPPVSPTPVSDMSIWIFALAMPVGGVILARRNLRLGRGDRQGAFRVAVFVFATYALARFFRADHLGRFADELWLLIKVVAYPSFWAAQVWLLYIALEPYVRRRWPHVLISWKRLLTGNLRDPLVGRDMLMGAAAGTFLMLSFFGAIVFAATHGLGPAPNAPAPFADGATLTAFRHVGFRLFVNQFSAVLFAMVYLFMLVLFRVILRTSWLAVPVWCLLVGLPVLGQHPAVEVFAGATRALVLLLVLTRGGLLALATALFYMFILFEMPFTLDFSAWYAPRALPVVVALAGLALFAFHTSLAGKPLFGRALLED